MVGTSYAKAIRKNRIRQHLSQQFLAESIGITRQAVSQFENGRCTFSDLTIRRLNDVLNIACDFKTKNKSRRFVFRHYMISLLFLCFALMGMLLCRLMF